MSNNDNNNLKSYMRDARALKKWLKMFRTVYSAMK